MNSQKKLIVSHAPFLHNGSKISERNLHIIYAALPAILFGGFFRFGIPAIGVVCLAVSTAMLWELIMNKAMQRPVSIGDGNAALIGLLFAMLLPATAPWWLVVTGTFVAIVIGKQIFGGIGGNAFNPVALSIAILMMAAPFLWFWVCTLKRKFIMPPMSSFAFRLMLLCVKKVNTLFLL